MITEKKLIEMFGAANVTAKQAVLEEYSSDMSFVKETKPEYVVKVRNTEDIEKLIKLANETLTPLVPVSSGPPHFRGDTVPSTGGAIIVDLSKMKKIVMVNRDNRVALFEPGVTFDELISAVTKEGLRLNIPLQPRKTKSVIGSMLEREPVIMPKYHWDISDPLASTQVVFGTGDKFRTGAASGPGTIKEQWAAGGAQKEAAGPSAASWHRIIQGSQGTMGIVAWASARCELLPKLEEPFLIGSSDLGKIMEVVHWLVRLRLVNECLILNNMNVAAIMAKKMPQEHKNLKDNLPPWILLFNIASYEYLPEERMHGQIKDMRDVTQRIGLEAVQAINTVSAFELLEAIRHPSQDTYWKMRYKGDCYDIFFLTIYDKLPGLIETMYSIADRAGYPASDIGIYLQPVVQGTSCHCEFNLFYNRKNPNELAQIRELSTEAIKELMNKGAFFSRPYGENTSTIMNRDAATVETFRKVKTILDPNNIMNPGKLCF